MHKAIWIIFLLQSPIATTPYRTKIKSFSSSDKKKKSLFLSWENFNSGYELFWVQVVSAPVDTIGLGINNWTQGARIPISWQVAFTPQLKKTQSYPCLVSQWLWNYFIQNRISPKQGFQVEAPLSLCAGPYLSGAETHMQIHWLPDAKPFICKMFWGY